jgi:hypothetical protein
MLVRGPKRTSFLDSALKNGSGMALQEAFPDLPPLSPSPIEMRTNFEILGLFMPSLRHFTPFYANSPVVTKVSS